MDIYIGKDGQVLGPYYPYEIRKRLKGDLFDGSERAWHEELDEWIKLDELKVFACSDADCQLHGKPITIADAQALGFECVLCKSTLGEPVSVLSPLEEQIVGTYPSLIAAPFARLHERRDVEAKQSILVNNILTNLFKYLTLVVKTEYLLSTYTSKQLTEFIQNKLAYRINLTSWPMFLVNAIPALEEQDHEFHIFELPNFFKRNWSKGNKVPSTEKVKLFKQGYWNKDGEFVKQYNSVGRFDALVKYRNDVSHDSLLPKSEAQEKFQYYYQILLDCLEAMEWCANYPLYKHEEGQIHRLMGTSPVSEGPSSATSEQEGNLYLGHPGDQSPLQLAPLFIVPRDYLPDSDADLFFYDQCINKAIKYVSPKGYSENIEETVEHWKRLLRNKQVLWSRLGKTDLNPAELSRRSLEATGHARNDLRRIGKVIKGLYYSRQEIEANLMGWSGSMPPLLALRSAAGGGKTCMMDHVAGQWQEEKLPVLFIRAQGLEEIDLLKLIQDRLRLDGEVTFADLAGALDQPLLILIDGLNEHAHPKDFLASILAQAGEAGERTFKCFFTVRSENLDWVELDEEQKQLFQPEVNPENALTKEKEEKLPGPLLTPLDRLEVEAMWKDYAKNDPKRFKPRFSFEEAQRAKGAQVDAMEWMSRPLLLRLFLEVYHRRDCPSVIGRYPLFSDYLKQVGEKTRDQNAFLLNVGRVCLEEETIVLDLDTLFKDSRTQEVMNDSYRFGPFDRLIKEGVLVELREGETIRIGFGVESFAEHVLGEVLLADGAADTPHGLAKVLEDKDFPQIKRAVQVALQAKVEEQGREYLFEFIDAPVEGVGWVAGGVLGQLILESGEATLIADDLMANPTPGDLGTAEFAASYLDKEMVYQPAVDFLSRVVELAEKPFADTKELAGCFFSLAEAFRTAGEYDQALKYHQKALAIRLKQLGSDHPDVAMSYNSIGMVHTSKGDYDQALEFHHKDLTLSLKCLGLDHSHVAASYNNMGLAYKEKGECDQALECYQKALTSWLKRLGPDHPNVAACYNNIGSVHGYRGEYDQALEYHQKSLAISLSQLGADHAFVVGSYNNIGAMHYAKGEYDQALEYAQKALVILLKQRGPDHPHVAIIYGGIGGVHRAKGDYDQALENYQKSLAIQLKQLGSNHPVVAKSYRDIGLVHDAEGARVQAQEYLEKALAIYEGRGNEAKAQQLREQIANLESKPATE